MRGYWIAWFLLMIPSPVFADSLTGELALFYMNDSGAQSLRDNDDQPYTVKTKTSYSFTAMGFCYRLDWVCIGLKYLQGSVELSTSNSSNSSSTISTESFTGPGLTLGASFAEWVMHGTFMVGAAKNISDKITTGSSSSSSGIRYPAQIATILDLGYGFKVGSLRVGPLLSVLHMDYKKRVVNGSTETLPSKESDDFIMPHFALWMDF